MGKVVPFKRPEQPLSETDQFADLREDEVGKKELTRQGKISILIETVLPIRKHLSVLVGSVSERNVDERRKGLVGYSDAGLIHIAQKSTYLNWDEKPAYFWALVEEIEDRLQPPPPSDRPS